MYRSITESPLDFEITRVDYVLGRTHNEITLRKQAYSNILKILLPKNENFQIKIRIFFFVLFLLKT